MAKRAKPAKTKIKNWLKGKGHNTGLVDGEIDKPGQNGAAGLRTLHGVSVSEYRAAGGKD